MNYQNKRDLPGCGDCLRPEPVDHDAAIESIASTLYDAHMHSESWVNEAQGELTDAEYKAINLAIIDGDDMQAGYLMRLAVMRVTKEYCDKEAALRYRKLHRADLRDLGVAA